MSANNGHLRLTERQISERIAIGALARDFGQYGNELQMIYSYVSLASSLRSEGDSLREQGRVREADMKYSKAKEFVGEAKMHAMPIGIEII